MRFLLRAAFLGTAAGGIPTFSLGCAAHNTPSPAPMASLAAGTTRAAMPADSGLSPGVWVASIEAYCPVPAGWSAEPNKSGDQRDHQVWLSPTGATAYGVLTVRNFLMPLASNERVLGEFLKGMNKAEGRADLLSKNKDSQLGGFGGLRFVAEGGRYRVSANLVTHGTRAWIYYAGARRGEPINIAEMALAERAREATIVGAPSPARPAME